MRNAWPATTSPWISEKAQKEAGEFSRQVARKLRARSLTGRDIAAVLRVSPQRVSQLLRAKG